MAHLGSSECSSAVQILVEVPMSPFENQLNVISNLDLTETGMSILKIRIHADAHSLLDQILQRRLVDYPSQRPLPEHVVPSEVP